MNIKMKSKRALALMLTALLLNVPALLVGTSVQAQSLKELRAKREAAKLPKLAPDLEVLLADDDEEEGRYRNKANGGRGVLGGRGDARSVIEFGVLSGLGKGFGLKRNSRGGCPSSHGVTSVAGDGAT